MGRQKVQVGLVLALALVLIGQPPPTLLTLTRATPQHSAPDTSPSPTAEPWNLDADIGAVMVMSWRGSVDWSVVRPVLLNNDVGGVLLFTPNFGGSPDGLKGWTDRIQAVASSACLSTQS